MGVASKMMALLLALLLASPAVCLAGRGGPGQTGPDYAPQTIFQGGDNDPLVGIGSFVPGDGYGLGPAIGEAPLVGYVQWPAPLVGYVPVTTPTVEVPVYGGGGGGLPAVLGRKTVAPAGGAAAAAVEAPPAGAGVGGGGN